VNIDDYQVQRRFSIEEITEINLIIIYDSMD